MSFVPASEKKAMATSFFSKQRVIYGWIHLSLLKWYVLLRCLFAASAEDMKQKPKYHGQAVFILPSDPLKVLDGDMLTVQLMNGKRITTKETHLREEKVN